MSENNEDAQQQPENTEDKQEKKPVEKTFTQEQVNKMVGEARMDARKKERAKYADYEELKKFREETAPRLERLEDLEAEKKHQEMCKQVSEEVGLSFDAVSRLSGNTAEELTENAKALKETIGVPVEPYGNAHGTPKPKTSKDIFGEVLSAFD